MVIGGTYRDVAIRASSTRDIDVVLIDRDSMDPDVMREAGFSPVAGSPHAWRYVSGKSKPVDLEVAATASSATGTGPFSVAFRHATTAMVEGVKVPVPALEDYIVLKLLAAESDIRRRVRDLPDIHYALVAYPDDPRLTVAAIRARLRDLYGERGDRLKRLVATFRTVPRG